MNKTTTGRNVIHLGCKFIPIQLQQFLSIPSEATSSLPRSSNIGGSSSQPIDQRMISCLVKSLFFKQTHKKFCICTTYGV